MLSSHEMAQMEKVGNEKASPLKLLALIEY